MVLGGCGFASAASRRRTRSHRHWAPASEMPGSNRQDALTSAWGCRRPAANSPPRPSGQRTLTTHLKTSCRACRSWACTGCAVARYRRTVHRRLPNEPPAMRVAKRRPVHAVRQTGARSPRQRMRTRRDGTASAQQPPMFCEATPSIHRRRRADSLRARSTQPTNGDSVMATNNVGRSHSASASASASASTGTGKPPGKPPASAAPGGAPGDGGGGGGASAGSIAGKNTAQGNAAKALDISQGSGADAIARMEAQRARDEMKGHNKALNDFGSIGT
jgi:hypothetical protein